jgi:integrase/recombinase XerD
VSFPDVLENYRRSFLEAMQVRRYSPATLKHRRDSLSVFFRHLASAGITDVREVSRQAIRDYQAALMQRYQIASAQAHLITVRRLFEHLETTDVVLVNPCAGLPLPTKRDRLPRTVLTREEARRVLNQPDTQTRLGIRDKAILEMFYSTGIRLDEMARLTIHDVDYRNGFVRVTGKGSKQRMVPVGRKACDYVREYLQKVRAEWSKANRDERALWLSYFAPHGPLKSQMIEVMVKQYGREAGMEKSVSPHVWRHTCATHLVSNGSNIVYVQRLLGHRSLSTTQVYTRVTVTELKAAHARKHPQARRKARAHPFTPVIGKAGQQLMYRKGQRP